MQLFDFASVSIVIASASVVFGVILAIMQMRDQNKTRQAQLFMEIYEQFSRSGFLDWSFKVREAFISHEGEGSPEIWETSRGNVLSVLAYYEGVGVLVKRNLVDINLVADLISTPCIFLWEAIESWVMWRRELFERPQTWEWIEYLYHEIRKIPSRVSTS
ncbi:MAG: DUF4760 domain-containing protein [Candidatus Thorarchaeota archaeon]